MPKSKVQQRLALLRTQLQRVRQSTVKGLSHTVSENAYGTLFVEVKYYDTSLVEFCIQASGRKILCEDLRHKIPVSHYHVAGKAYRHISKFVRLANEYK